LWEWSGYVDVPDRSDRWDRLNWLDWTDWPDWFNWADGPGRFDWSEWLCGFKERSVFGWVERPEWLFLFESPEWIVRFFIHPTVSISHVGIDGIRSEHSHTPPTNVHLALRASHMVATSVLLDHDFAFWALLDVVVTLSPTVQ